MSAGQLKKHSYTQPKMGSSFTVIFYAEDALFADALAARCFLLVDHYNMIFSDYDNNSELSRLCYVAGTGCQPVSQPMMELLAEAGKAWQLSEGTYDITAGPVVKCWREARKERKIPADVLLQQKMALTGFDKIRIDPAGRSVCLPIKGMELDFGGIAKGYIAKKVLELLAGQGITQALVNAGGDMIMSDPPPGKSGWTIGITIPEHTVILLPKKLSVSNAAVATSGDAYQYIVHDGKKYSHIIDPRTGYGITHQKNVTVVSSNATEADWLATACSILPAAAAVRLAESLGASFLITELQAGKIVAHTAGAFSAHWQHS